jgi:transcriptional regulator of heat shock response
VDDRELALQIAQGFTEMENEIRALRAVLHRYWTHETPAETFVQKGIQQLQARQREEQAPQRLESAFRAPTDDGSLMRTLHQETRRKVTVPIH